MCEQTKAGKIAWALVVCFGFIAAGYLIGKSYLAWQDSPVATSISTYPINDLAFPTVTVCPPRGSNTALNHDLIKLENSSLTEAERKHLKYGVYETFMAPSHEAYMRNMLSFANKKNLPQMLKGYHSTPKPYGTNGFEIIMWDNSGTYQTPWFGENFQEDYYKLGHNHHIVLEFPENLPALVGEGSLVIDLEVDTREEGEGWFDAVLFTENGRLDLPESGRMGMSLWEKAEEYSCPNLVCFCTWPVLELFPLAM